MTIFTIVSQLSKALEKDWDEIDQSWFRLAPTEGLLQPRPLFDLVSGEIYGFRAATDAERRVSNIKANEEFYTEAPGLPRGIHFERPRSTKEDKDSATTDFLLEPLRRFELEEEDEPLPTHVDAKDAPEDELDILLPNREEIYSNLENIKKNVKPAKPLSGWARSLDPNHIPVDYDSVVGGLASTLFAFELDPFQKQAVYHLERGDSVFVAAHTSSGKTAVAEYAIALAHKHLTKAIYTSPIKALSNQKFRDFRETFGEAEVGLLTGDVQIRSEAPCLIMTTEILRSMLYRGADLLADVEFVIFDEVHYVNDAERGVVWEEVIIMLPPHISLILLSATIPNTVEFADWVGRTRQQPIYVISTARRPIPLEHHLFCPNAVERGEILKLVDQHGNFSEPNFRKLLAIMRGTIEDNNRKKLPPGAVAPKNSQGGMYRGVKQEKSLWVEVVYTLKKKNLLPTVIFTFSKRKCEENADALSATDLNGASEKSAIRIFLDRSVAKLKIEDRQLPQIIRMYDLLSRGVAVHHSGLLPLMKEAVEILFARGLVKVLFATETFAMGVNMPARTVVFSSIRKHDGTAFRSLLAGEYTQMAGRAGRRGIDATGTVIIICASEGEVPGEATLRTMILGQPTKLTSQFRLTYSMLLNLIRVEALRVEEMLKRSFSEHAGQKELPHAEEKLAASEALLAQAEPLECAICEKDMSEFYSTSMRILEYGRYLWERVLSDARLLNRFLEPGRIIIINNNLLRNMPVVVIKGVPGQGEIMNLSCFALFNTQKTCQGFEDLPLPLNMINRPDLQAGQLQRDTFTFGPNQLVMITSSRLANFPDDLGNTTRYRPKDLDTIQDLFINWLSSNQPIVEVALPSFKSLDLDERRINRTRLLAELSTFDCAKCPLIEDHYAIHHKRRLLTESLAELQFTLSDASLRLLPEYRARLSLLKTLEYIDQTGRVQLKGRVACELNTVHELLTTELLFDNAFAESSPAEIVALLSIMVFQEKSDQSKDIELDHEGLKRGMERIRLLAAKLSVLEREHTLSGDLMEKLNFGLVEVVHQWALGVPFTTLTALTDVLEGSIVRCIVRLDETCRELRGAAKIMGDPVLYKKMEEASVLIKRDICFASSLYI